MVRLLVVGEMNPYGADPRMALYHLPRNASGDRLRRHLGLRDGTYERLDKENLCFGAWSTRQAVDRAAVLVYNRDVVLALGARVTKAFARVFGWDRPAFFTAARVGLQVLVSLPHPSGLSRGWNDRKARDVARGLLRSVVPDVPWGEVDA